MRRYFDILLFSIFIPIIGCTVPFDFNPESFEEVLVIEGTLTNETKSHIVRVSYTYPLTEQQGQNFVNDAIVIIEDQDGDQRSLLSIGEGEYITPSNFSGELGNSYRLIVRMFNGLEYQSSFEEMTPSPPIDSIYDRYTELSFDDQTENDRGIQFFVDTHDDSNSAQFFRYEYDETWQVRVPFPSQYEIVDEEIVVRQIPIGVCYEYNESNNYTIGTTANNSVNQLTEHPLVFVSQRSPKIRSRYTILAKQYALSEQAFLYYRKLKENNESTGSLFDKQTGTIVGNIINVDDPEEAVLGYFEVSGYSERRAFFSDRDFDDQFAPAQYRYNCRLDDAKIMSLDDAVTYLGGLSSESEQIFNIILTAEMLEGDAPDSAIVMNKFCTSCSQFADPNPPSYWE